MSTQPVSSVVEEYLRDLEPTKRAAVVPVFETVHAAMPDGYELVDFRGAPSWVVPLSTYPNTYNKQPLSYVALIAQKNYNSLYLLCLYSDSEEERQFRADWEATGRKLNMGKSCLRFTSLGDVDLPLVARTVASTPVQSFLETYERIRAVPPHTV
ncbi:DUF1801 domain-containing protein [Glaciihabitans sp. dw_435]|uniref:DUF1801 domain-containing protein n=1 Tax=Glaciihabitans sp. dw_435 TaxID=2720081 RepID=UPI001BD58A5C|nr:DUF1801 domain-containing protein [Glaciihabitans sp. dw_435]